VVSKIAWPSGKDFAFTIFDDPDLDSVENVAALYSFLGDLGLRTTKAVWPTKGALTPRVGGATCADEQYLKWIINLKEQGFEIALHNVTYHTSTREETQCGIERFHRLFGHYPHSMANHTGCLESIYWGNERLSGVHRRMYDLLHVLSNQGKAISEGHIESSPHFWGDVCKQKIKYVRNFVFGDINTLRVCPTMPYHDPARPYVNYWFAASEGPSVRVFNETLSERNQDRLVRERGACIMYSHLASGFLENGMLNRRFKNLMERMSRMNGWFVPVHTLLDFLLEARGSRSISQRERHSMERKWLWHKMFHVGGRS
jgi:hypothetical protein